MKKTFIALVMVSLTAYSCSKTETAQNTEPADYAETEQKLIKNRIQDSIDADSIRANSNTAMPPQSDPEKQDQ